jgi:hypothetical protein
MPPSRLKTCCMPSAAAISAATALRWPTSHTNTTLSDVIASAGLAMMCFSGVSVAGELPVLAHVDDLELAACHPIVGLLRRKAAERLGRRLVLRHRESALPPVERKDNLSGRA